MSDADAFHPPDRLRELLAYLAGFHRQRSFDALGYKPTDDSPLSRLEYFEAALLMGALPDADTMFFVGDAIYKYVDGKGAISLDQAFGLKSKQKVGNPSKQRATSQQLGNLLYAMACYRVDNPGATLADAAEDIASRFGIGKPDCETLVRYYSRRGWGKVEKMIPRLGE